MKIIKITSLFLFLISFNINSQSTLDSYSFGEGISFTADNGSKIKLSGYAQPHVEIKNYYDLEENSSTEASVQKTGHKPFGKSSAGANAGYGSVGGKGGTGYDAGSKALQERFQKLANIKTLKG